MRVVFPYMARWHSANWSRYHHLLTALARRGHHILVLQPPPLPGARETNYLDMDGSPLPNIEVTDLPLSPLLWHRIFPADKLVKKGLATLAARRVLRSLARHEAIDVLLLYNVPQMVLTKATSATVVVDVADDLLAMLAHEAGWAKGLIRPLARRAFESLITAADVVTTPSTILAEHLDRKVQVLPNGADFEAIAQTDGIAIRSDYPTPIVGFVGAFEYFVDFDLIFEVAVRLPDCTFLMVGGGRKWLTVKEEARRRGLANMHFTGPVPYAAALNHMAALDIALIPFGPGSVSDAASPLKLFEYGALRKPVVSTPRAEIRSLAGDWAFFGASADEWVAIIQDILRWPNRVSEKVQRGYQTIETQYRWDGLASRFEALIKAARK